MATTVTNLLLSSEKVKVYPTAFRGGNNNNEIYDPGSRLNTEENSVAKFNAISDTQDGFVLSDAFDSTFVKPLSFILHGYLFKVDLSDVLNEFSTNIYASIKTYNKGQNDFSDDNTTYSCDTLVNFNSTTGETNLDDGTNFTGLVISDSEQYEANATIYNLLILTKDTSGWKIPDTSKLKMKADSLSVLDENNVITRFRTGTYETGLTSESKNYITQRIDNINEGKITEGLEFTVTDTDIDIKY